MIDSDDPSADAGSLIEVPRGPLPCSYTVSIGWTPTLRYYENRLQPFSRLERSGWLRSFLVAQDFVDGRLDQVEMRLTSTELTLMSSRPLDDQENAGIITDVLAAVEPKPFTRVWAMLQYVVPLSEGLSYDEVRLEGLKLFSATENLDQLGADDFALIVSGSEAASTWVIESGIVERNELGPRCLRTAGFFKNHPSSEILMRNAGSPKLAFFCDSQWALSNARAIDTSEALIQRLTGVQAKSQDVVPHLVKGLVGEKVSGLRS